MNELPIGLKGQAETTVNEQNTAAAMGSGLLPVFATPAMLALMENAAASSIQPYLGEGEGTVGTRLEVSHLAATPIYKAIPNFRQTRIAMLRAETMDELLQILESTRSLKL